VTNLEQTKNPLVIILQLMAQRASADRGPRNGAESWAFVRATHNERNTWHWWEVMAHGNLVDCSSGGGPTRRGRLGLLSLALVVVRWARDRAQHG
jgi:MYXO-CTERM domain-containing protein